MSIFIGAAIYASSFFAYYYVVKIKGAALKSWKYSLFTALNIAGCIWISNDIIRRYGSKMEGFTLMDLAGIAIVVVVHWSSIGIAHKFIGAPLEEEK